jgi:hypothetical protein
MNKIYRGKICEKFKGIFSLHKKALELTVITEERGDGSGKEPNPNTARKPAVLYNTLNTLRQYRIQLKIEAYVYL